MKRNKFQAYALLAALSGGLMSCGFFKTDQVIDPNNIAVVTFINNPTRDQINLMAVGLQAAPRNGYLDMIRITASVGREGIYSASTDNRYFTEILGTTAAAYGGANDPNGIFNTYYTSFSSTRRQAEFFSMAAQSSSALTEAEKAGAKGFARTIQGYAMLNLLNMQFNNGIRSGYTDLNSPGDLLRPLKFTNYASGLDLVIATLNEGAASLDAAGPTFSFASAFTSGWAGFTTPTDVKKVNRAFAARAFMYKQDWASMLTALNQSFLNLSGSLSVGPKFNFANAQNDIANTLFQNPDANGAPYVLFDEVVTSAEPGDTRIAAKTRRRTSPRSSGGIVSNYELQLYPTNASPISIIRNEELVLMYAEAKAQTGDLAEAIRAINIIRSSAGLSAYSGASTKDALISEILKQRRYSLLFEGHRWFDARRYNRLGTLPNSTAPYKVFENLVRPNAETQWELANPL
ncbi:RagB/SusD family nutrient uptake outer membrane protein [Spirosoma taeanense]|uniref:RagB/SusD family nutrient uptake outer membrane protein n=1 Tax=Spirosoma taeanense TaxID=2735870 RepID=A0A6M5YA38_9BACT|nr:RagB/SusD family nutrient uptake outer membrane protein [Spirosoma taeanense]QJW90236.1 RagB/SusD family nutrient uptake outer membrane protein [Spirosoma taeanense]